MAFVLSSRWCIFAFWLALLGSLRTTCATRARIRMQCWVWGATASPNLRTQTNRTTRSGHPCQTRNSRGSHSFGSGRTRPGWRRFGTLPIVISHKSSTFSRLFLGWIASAMGYDKCSLTYLQTRLGPLLDWGASFSNFLHSWCVFHPGRLPCLPWCRQPKPDHGLTHSRCNLTSHPFSLIFHQVWPPTKSRLSEILFCSAR